MDFRKRFQRYFLPFLIISGLIGFISGSFLSIFINSLFLSGKYNIKTWGGAVSGIIFSLLYYLIERPGFFKSETTHCFYAEFSKGNNALEDNNNSPGEVRIVDKGSLKLFTKIEHEE